MKNFEKKPKFEIQTIIEQKPFESRAVQSFFAKWCEINDSIQLKVVTREQWNNRGMQEILVKSPDGKQTLFIPTDLKLWEMIGVMEAVDKETFATKPEKITKAKEKMLALGKTFENAGVYIARRIDGIQNGKEIAEELMLEFYEYGQSLVQGDKQKIPQISDIALQNLSSEEIETVDRFLAEDSLYESRKHKIEKLTADDQVEKERLFEEERQKTLSQFFRVAEKAFALESKSVDGKLRENPTKLKPWQSNTPIHSAFLKRIEKALTKQIETPKREFEMAVFRRGLEKLTGEMRERSWKHSINSFFEKLGLNLRFEERRLIEILNISQFRIDLEALRQKGDTASIASKEREIADKIQEVVSNFPYQLKANNPSEMVASKYINCVGASILGGALMKESSLNYLVGDLPEHSFLFLVTSDGQVEWRDMLDASFNENLTDEMIKDQKRDGKPLTVSNIVAFSQKPSPEGLMFGVDSPKYRDKLHWVKEGQHQYVTVFEPEYGQKIQLLLNTSEVFFSLKCYEEAVEALKQAIALDPKSANFYYALGLALNSLGQKDEAVEAYQKFIDLANEKSGDHFIRRAKQIIAKIKKQDGKSTSL